MIGRGDPRDIKRDEIEVGDVVIVVDDAAFVLTALFMANLLIFSTSSLTLTPSFPCRPSESIAVASCI